MTLGTIKVPLALHVGGHARVSNCPCLKCGHDTLHKGLVCSECGEIVQMTRSFGTVMRQRIKRAFGNKGKDGAIAQMARDTYRLNQANKLSKIEEGADFASTPNPCPRRTKLGHQ